jgi:hypothetical protein
MNIQYDKIYCITKSKVVVNNYKGKITLAIKDRIKMNCYGLRRFKRQTIITNSPNVFLSFPLAVCC